MDKKTFTASMVITVALLVGALFLAGGPKTTNNERLGQEVEIAPNKHLSDVNEPHEPYNTIPATSGAHLGESPANSYGIYDEPIRDEEMLHGLEHGAVGINYSAKAVTEEEIEQLKKTFDNLKKTASGTPKAYLVPRNDLADNIKVALVAWGYILEQPDINLSEIEAFYNSHVGRGPENAP